MQQEGNAELVGGFDMVYVLHASSRKDNCSFSVRWMTKASSKGVDRPRGGQIV